MNLRQTQTQEERQHVALSIGQFTALIAPSLAAFGGIIIMLMRFATMETKVDLLMQGRIKGTAIAAVQPACDATCVRYEFHSK